MLSKPWTQPEQPFAYPSGAVRLAVRLPIALYRLGLGMVIGSAPIMVLTTRGRRSGLPRYTPLEYRQHGSKYYLISAWGRRAHWVQNLLASPDVTVQCGHRTYAARARLVDDAGEASRAAQLFRRQTPYLYETLLARLFGESVVGSSQALSAPPSTIVRLDRLPNAAPPLPPLRSDMAWVLPAVMTMMMVTLGILVATRTRRS